MAGLAFHGMLAGRIDRIAHGASQALGLSTWMAVEAGIPVSDTVQPLGRARKFGIGVTVMHGRSHTGDIFFSVDSPNCQGVAVMAGVAQDWLAVMCRRFQTGTITFLREQVGVGGSSIFAVVQSQDIKPPVFFRIGRQVHPTGCGLGSTAAGSAGMAGVTVDFTGNRQHRISAGDGFTGTGDGSYPDHWKIIGIQIIIDRGNGNAGGLEPFIIRTPGKWSRTERWSRIAGETKLGNQINAEQGQVVFPEVGLILAGAIDRACRVGCRFIGQDITTVNQLGVHHQLGIQVVERRQQGENREIGICTVHAQVVPGEQMRSRGRNDRGTAGIATCVSTSIAASIPVLPPEPTV